LEYIRAYVQASRAKEDFQTELLKAFNREEIEYIDIPEMDFGYYPLMGSMSEMATAKQHSNITDQVETLKKKKQKIERALSRLDDAYFFSDDTNVISKSEYLVKKASFQQELQKIDSKISSLPVESSLSTGLDMDLLSRFLLLQNLFSVGSIRDSLLTLDKHVVQDFLQKTISYIEVADKKVTKIAFHSPAGDVIHQFIYKNTAVNH
jgi:hypothetical protein